tara:strand:+ start:481 stop:666 length:186 start_codon:yes stop_codon:yes gene_type:complete
VLAHLVDADTAAALFEQESVVMTCTHMPPLPVIPYHRPFVLLENLFIELIIVVSWNCQIVL